MDRRTTLRWIAAAAAYSPLLSASASHAESGSLEGISHTASTGYGKDPDLLRGYHPGDLWPLTCSAAQRRTATTLCDVIVPADDHSPSASSLGVVDFIDEWISAPYPAHIRDRQLVLFGLQWMDAQSKRRFGADFSSIADVQRRVICDDICYVPKATARYARAAKFFARYRDLTAGGFCTTPAGRADLGYVGNAALTQFDGPPHEVLKKVGLT
jgi:hypothetical protein